MRMPTMLARRVIYPLQEMAVR
ncbi:MAG: hypothetical protein H6R26_3451, partial [Proteobacteria bacterium]|nr:hypothetical protein [Pseudomonadota bacterium]